MRQRREDSYKFQVSLVYIVIPGQPELCRDLQCCQGAFLCYGSPGANTAACSAGSEPSSCCKAGGTVTLALANTVTRESASKTVLTAYTKTVAAYAFNPIIWEIEGGGSICRLTAGISSDCHAESRTVSDEANQRLHTSERELSLYSSLPFSGRI